jgi:hypothetical protein
VIVLLAANPEWVKRSTDLPTLVCYLGGKFWNSESGIKIICEFLARN